LAIAEPGRESADSQRCPSESPPEISRDDHFTAIQDRVMLRGCSDLVFFELDGDAATMNNWSIACADAPREPADRKRCRIRQTNLSDVPEALL
jgi:hypothetical protein